ncbi:MAG TPA: acylphosphatase [Patescibacteria group bacterium]|nr:acylphosphatase [Patescibacteria group bacterium]
MEHNNLSRAEIIVKGKVQGVGFRRFVEKEAERIDVQGFTENLDDGNVRIVAEGFKSQLADLLKSVETGPQFSQVEECCVEWHDFKNEFHGFSIKR